MPAIPEEAYVHKYGAQWPPILDQKGRPVALSPDWLIEALILKNYDTYVAKKNVEVMPWEEHFMEFVKAIWGRKECGYKFIWNPYAKRMLEGARKHKFLGVSGHASSGKSQFLAIWVISKFLIDPANTKALVTSTSLQDSRGRVWGVIEKYWEEARVFLEQWGPLPGKLVSSSGKIVGTLTGKADDLVGIALVAGGKGNDGEASTKIGFKASGSLILAADELPLLTHKLYDSATNLLANKGFQMIGTGNLTSIFDPFGLFVEPEGGWDSVTEDDYEWKTKVGGYCIRFDGEQSPNVKAKQMIYPGILDTQELSEIKERYGLRSPGYYRMIKSFPCPTGNIDSIYTEPELNHNMVAKSGSPWLDRPIPLAFLDPSFSQGGDRAAAAFGLLGYVQHPVTRQQVQVLEKTATLDLMKDVNARHPDKDRNEQLAELFIKECDKREVAVHDRGADITGGGDPFSTILTMKMGAGMTGVSFAGAASDMRISATDKRTGKDRFANRVSELWFIGKEFISSEQIKGLDPTTMLEMCARTYKEIGSRVLVEKKLDMKKRTNGRSPDFADAWVGLIEVARRRYGFTPSARAKQLPPKSAAPSNPYAFMFAPAVPERQTMRDQAVSSFSGSSSWGE